MHKWIVTESFGDSDKVDSLIASAISMAKVTGSVGASYRETDTKGNTIAFARVERDKA